MKEIITCLLLFGSLIVVGQADSKKLEQLKAQLEMIQKMTDSLNKANKKGTNSKGEGRPPVNSPNNRITNLELPKPVILKITGLPKKILSLTEIAVYIKNLHKQLSEKLPAGMVNNANALAKELGYDPMKLESAAWYAFQNSKYAEAVLLITEAAIRRPNDGLLLTNAGAILDMSGLSDKAIPILRTTLQNDPKNSIAINNLAQAYCALGMIDSAMIYLNTCIRLSPQHPEANHTAGQIESAKGNKEKAKTYFENAIRGGFSVSAYQGLKSITRNELNAYRIKKLIGPKVKFPDYFNQYKYKLPRLCTDVGEAKAVKAEQAAFIEQINLLKKKFDKLRIENERILSSFSPEAYNKQIMEKINNKLPIVRPFQVMAGIVAWETTTDYTKDLVELSAFNKENRAQLKTLQLQYEADYKTLVKSFELDDDDECCGEGDVSCCVDPSYCIKVNTLRNKYLSLFKNIDEDWQQKNLAFQRKYLDDLLYWEPLAANSNTESAIRFYSWVSKYLDAIASLAKTSILDPCKAEKDIEQEVKDTVLAAYDCDLEFHAKFLVGKITLDCDKFSIEGGEILVGKIERNFTSRQTTLSLGVGVYVGVGESFAGVGAGAEAGMSMSVFLNIDKTGALTDGGIVNKASASASLEFESGEKLGFKKKLAEQSIGFESRLGINSGWTFDEGPLRNLFPPNQPIQENKKVKLYPQQ